MGIIAHRMCGGSGGGGGGGGGGNGGGGGSGIGGQLGDFHNEVNALPDWLEARVSKHGVPFYKYILLREAEDPEDDVCEYEKQTLANIAENRKKLEELGLL